MESNIQPRKPETSASLAPRVSPPASSAKSVDAAVLALATSFSPFSWCDLIEIIILDFENNKFSDQKRTTSACLYDACDLLEGLGIDERRQVAGRRAIVGASNDAAHDF